MKVFLSGGKYFSGETVDQRPGKSSFRSQFMRVHRSYMVSFDKISGYNGVSVQLSGHEIPIGRLYKQVVMERLQDQT